MKTAIVIPARLESTRFPRKVLAAIRGRPMLWHVWDNMSCVKSAEVYVATDSSEIAGVVTGWGGHVLMTGLHIQTGTERVAAVLDRIDAELIVNVQADEPLLPPAVVGDLAECWRSCQTAIATPVFRITSLGELQNPNLVKVVRSATGRALYFSRAAVPFIRDVPLEQWLERGEFWGHIGIYAFRRDILAAYSSLPPSRLEDSEKLEQLRYLDAGFRVQTVAVDYSPTGVDTPEDLEQVRERLGDHSETANSPRLGPVRRTGPTQSLLAPGGDG
jgi:3-deoxy-manno-octulosonate cytidylyltransferase (CMP-KDO synthetase)